MTDRAWWGEALLGDPADDRLWLVSHGGETRNQLRADVSEIAGVLEDHGVGERCTVMVRMIPSTTYLKVLLALWSRGAQVILVDHRCAPAEFDVLAGLLDPQVLLESRHVDGPVTGVRDRVGFTVSRRPSGTPASSDACLVQFSSGSTGRPKIIGRSGASLLAEIDRHTVLEGFPEAGERVLVLNSVVHTMGLVTGVLTALHTGAGVVLPPSHRPAEVLRLAAETGVAAIFGVPAHFELLLTSKKVRSLPALRLAVCGGERLPTEVYEGFLERFGVPIGQVYGTTETGLLAGGLHGPRPPAVGALVPGVEARIVDEELYVRLPRSPYLFDDQPERYADGWLRTFDRFAAGDAADLVILGRLDSLVTIGGLKVDLTEVEATLLAHPDVSEVVVTFGEVVEAYVAAEATLRPDDLTEWCRTRLSPVKVPKRFHLAERLPRNTTGKLIRNRELIRERITTHAEVGIR